jgi:hypothetical protein
MSKFADDLFQMLEAKAREDPFEVVEVLIALAATLMANDKTLDLERARTICMSIFHHGWNLRRRAEMPCDKSVH